MTAPKPGAALVAALKAADTRKGKFDNAKANQAAEKELLSPARAERFWSKVNKTDSGCWLWLDAPTKAGYGKFNVNRVPVLVHRLAYGMCVGAIPDGYEIHHQCRTRLCVNPAHLKAITVHEHRMEHRRLPTGPAREALAMRAANPHVTANAVARELNVSGAYVADLFRKTGPSARSQHRWLAEFKRSLVEGMFHDGWTRNEMKEALGINVDKIITALRREGRIGRRYNARNPHFLGS